MEEQLECKCPCHKPLWFGTGIFVWSLAIWKVLELISGIK